MSLTQNSSRSRVKPDDDASAEVTRPVSPKTLRYRGRTHPAARALDWTPPPAPYISEGPLKWTPVLGPVARQDALSARALQQRPGLAVQGPGLHRRAPRGPWKLPVLWTSQTNRSPTAPWKTLRVSHSSHNPRPLGLPLLGPEHAVHSTSGLPGSLPLTRARYKLATRDGLRDAPVRLEWDGTREPIGF